MMPQVRIRNVSKEYKLAAGVFSPELLKLEEHRGKASSIDHDEGVLLLNQPSHRSLGREVPLTAHERFRTQRASEGPSRPQTRMDPSRMHVREEWSRPQSGHRGQSSQLPLRQRRAASINPRGAKPRTSPLVKRHLSLNASRLGQQQSSRR